MQFKDFNAEAVCEMLLYLADYEEFHSLKEVGISPKEAKDILRELVFLIKSEVGSSEEVVSYQQKASYSSLEISSQAQSLISCLSPREEMLLFRSFKLV